MSLQKQISILSKLCAIYEEIHEENFYETDVDNYFYQSILDIALIGYRVLRVSEAPKKNFFQTISFLRPEKINKDSLMQKSCQLQ